VANTIILDLNSVKAASWLKQPDVCINFMQHFIATSVLKDFKYQALAEFVPITFLLEVLAAL
jgi:hypothetical protein